MLFLQGITLEERLINLQVEHRPMSSNGNGESAPNEQYPDAAFLEAIREGNRGTAEIADAVGCNRRTADYRLRKLEEQGEVTGEKVVRSLVWSIDE